MCVSVCVYIIHTRIIYHIINTKVFTHSNDTNIRSVIRTRYALRIIIYPLSYCILLSREYMVGII